MHCYSWYQVLQQYAVRARHQHCHKSHSWNQPKRIFKVHFLFHRSILKSNLDYHAQSGHRAVVFDGSDIQPALESGDLQRLSLYKFTLRFCNSGLGCKLSLCCGLDSRGLHYTRSHDEDLPGDGVKEQQLVLGQKLTDKFSHHRQKMAAL